jgi:hypothetical protein
MPFPFWTVTPLVAERSVCETGMLEETCESHATKTARWPEDEGDASAGTGSELRVRGDLLRGPEGGGDASAGAGSEFRVRGDLVRCELRVRGDLLRGPEGEGDASAGAGSEFRVRGDLVRCEFRVPGHGSCTRGERPRANQVA